MNKKFSDLTCHICDKPLKYFGQDQDYSNDIYPISLLEQELAFYCEYCTAYYMGCLNCSSEVSGDTEGKLVSVKHPKFSSVSNIQLMRFLGHCGMIEDKFTEKEDYVSYNNLRLAYSEKEEKKLLEIGITTDKLIKINHKEFMKWKIPDSEYTDSLERESEVLNLFDEIQLTSCEQKYGTCRDKYYVFEVIGPVSDISYGTIKHYVGDSNKHYFETDYWKPTGPDGGFAHYWKCDKCNNYLQLTDK